MSSSSDNTDYVVRATRANLNTVALLQAGSDSDCFYLSLIQALKQLLIVQ